MVEKWKLVGWDVFGADSDRDNPKDAYYPLGEFGTEEEAQKAAAHQLEDLEQTQPSHESGGQGRYGIQDRVFIERPDGTSYRYLPADQTPP